MDDRHKLAVLEQRILDDIKTSLENGNKRTLTISPPATGKTYCAITIATDFMNGNSPVVSHCYKPKVLYIGSNHQSVQYACEQIASTTIRPHTTWDFYHDSQDRNITGITWRQVIREDLSPNDFDLIIADDTHRGVSQISTQVLENTSIPIIGFTNSLRHANDTLTYHRTGTNIAFRIGEGNLQKFYGNPVTLITYEDLLDLGINRSVPIIMEGYDSTLYENDPRISTIVDKYFQIKDKSGSCQTLIVTDTIENAVHLKKILDRAFSSCNKTQLKPNVALFNSSISPQIRDLTYDRFISGDTNIIIHCGALNDGYSFKDLSLVIVAQPMRVPYLYERVIGRLFHSEKDDLLVIDLASNPTHLHERGSYWDNGEQVKPSLNRIRSIEGINRSSTINFGTQHEDCETINTDMNSLAPVWTRETIIEALSQLHIHGIGKKGIAPSRNDIAIAAKKGLCPPEWILVGRKPGEGFFDNMSEMAIAIGLRPTMIRRSTINKENVIAMVRELWLMEHSEDDAFKQDWLKEQCRSEVLPFRFRSIIGRDAIFPTFSDFTKELGLTSAYFRNLKQDEALDQIQKLYKRINGKKPIAKRAEPLKMRHIREGSIQRICGSPFNLFETFGGHTPVFPGGLDEVNRLLGFTIFEDLSKEEVLESIHALSLEDWSDRDFPCSQSEINKAHKKGHLPFSIRQIIGQDKMWSTKDDLDEDLGYSESKFHYRSLRQQRRFQKDTL